MNRRETAELLVRCLPPFHLSRCVSLLLFRGVVVEVSAVSLLQFP